MKKLSVVAAANNTHFLSDIIDALPVEVEKENLNDADIIWLEWADGDCLRLLQDDYYLRKHLRKKKVIFRIHRYELFNKKILEEISKIDHDAIDHLLFVSPYVKKIGISYFPWMERGIVLPNLINVDRFPFHDREEGFNLLFLGRISYVKNLPMIMSFFYELIKTDNRYHLHLVGDIHENELIYYLDNFLDKTELFGNVTIHGRKGKDELPEFMREMNFICSSSIFESFGVGILEGMATGLKPVVFNFPGAEYIFPEHLLYIDAKSFIEKVKSTGMYPKHYREFVLQNYSTQRKIGLYEDLLK